MSDLTPSSAKTQKHARGSAPQEPSNRAGKTIVRFSARRAANRRSWQKSAVQARLYAGGPVGPDGSSSISLQLLDGAQTLLFNHELGSADLNAALANSPAPQQAQMQITGPIIPLGMISSGGFVLSMQNGTEGNQLLTFGSIEMQLDVGMLSLSLVNDSDAIEHEGLADLPLTQFNDWELGLRKGEDESVILFMRTNSSYKTGARYYELGQLLSDNASLGQPQTGVRILPPAKSSVQGSLRQVDFNLWLQPNPGVTDSYIITGSLRCSWTIGGLDLIAKDIKEDSFVKHKRR